MKKAIGARAEAARDMRAHPGPADLAALPTITAAIGGLGSVPLDLVSAYVGLDVQAIRPLDRLGPEGASLVADKLRGRLRAAGGADPDLPAGELFAGQNEARLERLRASGLTEDQLAVIEQKIAEVTEVHQRTGWTIDFVNANHASVQLFDLDAADSDFGELRAKFESQHTRAGAEAMHRNPLEFAVHRIDDAPYEAYYKPGTLAARGKTHEVSATASHLGTMQLDRTLAALAALALHSLEG